MILSVMLCSLMLLFSSLFSFASAANSISNRKIIYYHGTITEHGQHVPLLPNSTGTVVTNILIATFTLNSTGLFINSLRLDDPSFDKLWSDKTRLEAQGIKFSAMLRGNWILFHENETVFNSSYGVLSAGLKAHNFDGIDLDIEDECITTCPNDNPIRLNATIKLIDYLRADFGPDFLITMSPVASALWGGRTLSGFSYKAIEQERGKDIAWYNAQFYNGFGDAGSPDDYEKVVNWGFSPAKVVMGLSTNPANTRYSGGGYVNYTISEHVLGNLTQKYPSFAGVAGWEYMDSLPGGWPRPWIWSELMAQYMGDGSGASKRAVSFSA